MVVSRQRKGLVNILSALFFFSTEARSIGLLPFRLSEGKTECCRTCHCGRFIRRGYSARNVMDGSTCAARTAGRPHAIAEMPASSAITPT
jgi:hypothetical protein